MHYQVVSLIIFLAALFAFGIALIADAGGGNRTAPVNPAAGAGRGRGGPQASAASAAEIRAMLQNAASQK